MLVLTRRQNEKVNFPGLGISIEVVSTGPRKIQLGINAPSKIRVVRGELSSLTDHPTAMDQTSAESIKSELDSIAMAIRLSQNQLQQGLTEYAEQALDDAIELLSSMEEKICRMHDSLENGPPCVREANETYQIHNKKTVAQIIDHWFEKNFSQP